MIPTCHLRRWRRVFALALATSAAVVATSAATAAPWRRAIESRTVFTNLYRAPVAADGVFWVGGFTADADAVVARIDAAGAVETSATELSDFADEVVLERAADGGVYATDYEQLVRIAPDGDVRWSSSAGLQIVGSPAIAVTSAGDAVLFQRTSTGRLRFARYRATDGSVAWSRDLAVGEADCGVLNNVTPARGGLIQVTCITDFGGGRKILMFDGTSGERLADLVVAVEGVPAVSPWATSDATSDLFVQVGGRVMRIDPESRAVRWRTAASTYELVGRAGAALLLARDPATGESVALRESDGSEAWRGARGQLVPDGAGGAYAFEYLAGVSELRVSRIDLASGAVRWTDPRTVPYWGPINLAAASAGGVILPSVDPQRGFSFLGWTASGARTALRRSLRGTTYAYVDWVDGAILSTRESPDDASGRTLVASIDGANGAVRWESVLHESASYELAARGACATSGGVVVAVSAVRFDASPPRGPARIAGFDATSGSERWRIDLGSGFDGATAGSPFCDGANRAYVNIARRVPGSDDAVSSLVAIDGATGAVAWERPASAGGVQIDIARTDPRAQGPLLSRRNEQSVLQVLNLDATTGGTRWTTAMPDGSSIWTLGQRLAQGDAVVQLEIGAQPDTDMLVQRIDGATGAVRWGRRLDGPYGGRQLARTLSITGADQIYVAGRNTEGPTWGRGSLARLAADSGNVLWNVELPRPPLTLASPGNVRIVPDSDVVVARQVLSPVFDFTKPGRYELHALDTASGALRHARLMGPGSSSAIDPGPYVDEPTQLTVLPGGDVVTRRFEGGVGSERATVLQREPALPATIGDAAVTLRLGDASGVDPARIPFRVEASFVGATSLSSARLRTLFPAGVVIETAQCRVEGGGSCGASSRLRQLRQTVDLEPGARVVVEGTVAVVYPASQLGDFQAWFDMPWNVGETDPLDNVAVVRPGPAATTGLVADQRFSGSWFDPQRSGEGWILEMLPDGTALMFWFTYPPNGASGDQQWLIAQNGHVQGSRIVFDEIYLTSGTSFGSGFDPNAVRLNRWGDIRIEFDGCNSGRLTYNGRAPFGNAGPSTITRLTSLAGVGCEGPSSPPSAIRSGAWYDTQRAGEGWIVEALPDGRATVYWFTYSPDGNQAWTFGTGTLVGDRLRIDDMRRPRGTRFGTGFNAANVNVAPWGTLQIDFNGCNGGTLWYTSSEPGYDAATRTITRLTKVAGTNCP